ncbi:MAG: Ig-like domain-containing protein, partial [Vibrionaceae bacterium]
MSQFFKSLLALIVLPLFVLLTGCNSEGALTGEAPPAEPTVKLERIDITPSLRTTRGVSELTLAAGNTLPFEALGHHSDGSSSTLTDLDVEHWNTSDS